MEYYQSLFIVFMGLVCLILVCWRGWRFIRSVSCAQEEYRRLKEYYQLLVENSTDVIWTLDNDWNFTYISPSIKKLRGITPEQAMQ